jgi:transcription elongation factor GreB
MAMKTYKKPMTRRGFYRIAEEHRQLLQEVRPKIVEGIAIAAAEGDRSENAEYIYGKKRLREIDKRLKYLSGLIQDAELVDPENIRSDRIEFGATVTIKDENDRIQRWSIVGVGEAEVADGRISWQSPLAKSLMNRKVGDFTVVERPSGDMEYEVIGLEYIPIL